VPSGIFPIPEFRTSPERAKRPGLLRRVWTLITRNRLDADLAHGADPDSTPDLQLRAEQLASDRERRKLANALVEALGDARSPNLGALRLKTRRRHDAIREGADELLALVHRLRDDGTVEIRGMAMTARLVNDRASALYQDSGSDLQNALRAARQALETSASRSDALATAA
jgi:hypothetical protein